MRPCTRSDLRSRRSDAAALARRGCARPSLVHALLLALVLLLAGAAPTGSGLGVRGSLAAVFDPLDADGDGVEDLLEAWRDGAATWLDLVARAVADGEESAVKAGQWPAGVTPPPPGPVARGELRLLRLGGDRAAVAAASRRTAAAGGSLRVLHRIDRFGGVEVLAADPTGLRELLAESGSGRLLLDRDGTPALDRSSVMTGAVLARQGLWRLEGDWTASVAILDSGCDTAHDDLGDFSHDNADGPPPAVGDAMDWNSAASGWPLFLEYKVIGWHDVTDDFPLAAGPWDYHLHGTALAGVVAGSGEVDSRFRGLAPSARLTVIKFYDFDGVWRQWAGDFLAACAWLLDHRAEYRARVALCAVNWDVDAGLSEAMAELLAAGILPVGAMGNDGAAATPGYPASLPEVLSVGAVNDAGAIAAFSGRGRAGSGKPDLVAPGGGLLPTAGRIHTCDNEPNDTYSDRHGTSLAAAHVAAGALLLLEGMRTEGHQTPAVADDARVVAALLRATAAPVLTAESPDGTSTFPLTTWEEAPDSVRGSGLLQIPAALEALLSPVVGGQSVLDSLGGSNARQTLARRLALLPNRTATVQVVPSSGLDVALEIHDSRALLDPNSGLARIVRDDAGAGGLERASLLTPAHGFALVAVKRIAGSGRVTITVTEQTTAGTSAWAVTLGGTVSGWPVAGRLSSSTAPSVICSGLLDVDPQARTVHALDASGHERSGWPVTLFIPATLQGPLTAPLAWNLDGAAGDEVVVGSAYGKAYFITGAGALTAVDVAASNVALTAPVGYSLADGARRVAVVSAAGNLVRLAFPGSVVGTTPLGAGTPLAPAAGELDGLPGEELVVVFSDGRAWAVDAGGAAVPGWPRSLGGTGVRSPLLADLNSDGRHEIVVAQYESTSQERIVFRVLAGDGEPAAGDGAAAPAPEGGRWFVLGEPGICPDGTGDPPRVVLMGAWAVGATPDSLRWGLAQVSLAPGGDVVVTPVPGVAVRGLTPVGSLQLRWAQLPAPLGWNFGDGPGAEPEFTVSLGWEETIPGLQNLRGAFSAWLRPDAAALAVAAASRVPLSTGGSQAVAPPTTRGLLLTTPDGSAWVRVSALAAHVVAQPTGRLCGESPAWCGGRGDARNSGAAPLAGPGPTGVETASGARPLRLELWPNPAPGRLRVSWRGLVPGPARLDVYDLRGRRVRQLAQGRLEETGGLIWDGRADDGRPAAAGVYVFVLESAGGVLRGRAVMTR